MIYFFNSKVQIPVPLLEQVVELDNRLFPTPWSIEGWRGQLATEHLLAIFLVGTRVSGVALLSINPFDNTSHLLKVVVEKALRRQGIGEKILKSVLSGGDLKGVESILLEVSVDNYSAQSLYKKLGFQPLNIVKKFYANGDDAIRMTLGA